MRIDWKNIQNQANLPFCMPPVPSWGASGAIVSQDYFDYWVRVEEDQNREYVESFLRDYRVFERL